MLNYLKFCSERNIEMNSFLFDFKYNVVLSLEKYRKVFK